MLATEPKTKATRRKWASLQRLAAEDPSFRLHTDEESGQTIISCMGCELHLEIIVDRMKREFGVEANIGRPQVTYRETLRKKGRTWKANLRRQSGGKGQYGQCRADPGAAGAGQRFRFEDRHRGVAPREYIPSVEKGLREAMGTGVLAGYPVVDESDPDLSGRTTTWDSSEMAFRMAAIRLPGRRAKRTR
ncbi:hypothetical protein MJ585_18745 [Klebsiella pneumoniae]|nr:hypothetical protein MJ585_18745 [Klebsiella pneumoniae]